MRSAIALATAVLCAAAGCGTEDPNPEVPGSERSSDVVELYGQLGEVSTDAPPDWPCDHDPGAAGCPDAEVIGQLTLEGKVVAITSDTQAFGCGPNDARERRPTSLLFEGLDGIDTAFARLVGDVPTMHALEVHVGYCG